MSQTLVCFLPRHWTLEMVAARTEHDVGRTPVRISISEDRPGRRSLHVSSGANYAIVSKAGDERIGDLDYSYKSNEDISEKFRREFDVLSRPASS